MQPSKRESNATGPAARPCTSPKRGAEASLDLSDSARYVQRHGKQSGRKPRRRSVNRAGDECRGKFAHTVPSGFMMNSAAFGRFASPRRNDRADHAVRKAKKRRLICSALSRTYQTICLKNCFERRSAASSHLRGESEAVFKSGLRFSRQEKPLPCEAAVFIYFS